MAQKKIYVIIDSMNWSKPGIRFRRHRLGEYLSNQKDTLEILWVYPVNATPRKPKSYQLADQIIKKNPFFKKRGIKEWALPDYLPGRIMRYKSNYGHPQFAKLNEYLNNSNAKKVLWFAYPAFPYLIEMIDWDMTIYDCSDLWVEPSGGSRSGAFSSRFAKGLIESAEKKVIKYSNIIFASSDFLAERIETVSGRQAITVENGVDYSYFQKTDCKNTVVLDNIPEPKLGYVGAIRSKIDLSLIEELACFEPNWSIVLIGPDCLSEKSVFKRLAQRDNVFWTGEVDSAKIPDYIKALDVGLLPYRDLEYNKAVFPIKFYEYLSQGVPVVGCGLPSTKKYSENGIYLHVERDCFPQACKKALCWSTGDHNSYLNRRIKLAQKASWENKFNYMLEKIRDYA